MKNINRGKRQGTRGNIALVAMLGVLSVLAATPAIAQNAESGSFDSRWNPYLGCWRIVQENLSEQPVPLAPGTMVCVQPAGTSGVAINTTVDGKTVLEQTIVADGTAQPVSQAGCSGTQTSEWSRDGERLFTRVELDCTGRPTRSVSGITMLVDGQWVDAQATLMEGDHDVRLRRYQRTSDQFAGSAALIAAPASQMSIEDVIEASGKVLSPALEAALHEADGQFSLDSDTLKQLADAGVSPNVIDLMVAQAYPDRFRVERRRTYQPAPGRLADTSGSGSTTVIVGSAAYPYPAYDPFYYNSYYYSPFAYPYYWGSSYRYGYPYRRYFNNNYYFGYPGRSVFVPINPGSGGTGGTAQPTSRRPGDGVVVNGRGYTRVRPSSESSSDNNGATPTQRTTNSGRGVRGIRSGSASGSSSSSSGSSSGSASSGGYSSGGSSSGGGGDASGSGGGRTAQPR